MPFKPSEFPRIIQHVEKVGFELVATTNRVLNGPKAACLVSFGAGAGVNMATKGVFQQAGVLLGNRANRLVLCGLVALLQWPTG
jgi:hypothetical protein